MMGHWIFLALIALLTIALFSWLIGLLAFRSLSPLARAITTIGAAWVIAVGFFGSREGVGYLNAAIIYAAAGLFIGWFKYRKYNAEWHSNGRYRDGY